jgi:signal peptidase I
MGVSLRYRLVWVVGDSMRPTYRSGDLLVVDKWAYRSHRPDRGDVVVALYHGGWIVKRVVGLPTEVVEVRHGRVMVDGSRVPLDHAVELGFLDIAPGRLLADRYAILGDNRGVEPSAFLHAVVSPRQVLGKVVAAARL